MPRIIRALPPELTTLIFTAGNRKIVLVEGPDDQDAFEEWYRDRLSEVVFYTASNTANVEAFLLTALSLSTRKQIYGIVDRDFRADAEAEAWKHDPDARLFILWRYELENYLLEPGALREELRTYYGRRPPTPSAAAIEADLLQLCRDLCAVMAANWVFHEAGGVTYFEEGFPAGNRPLVVQEAAKRLDCTEADADARIAVKEALIQPRLTAKGIASGIQEQPSLIASTRYAAYLTAGVERWREYRDQLAPLGKKPLLFVMMNSTAEADDVAAYLRDKYPGDFAGDRLHVLHTDTSGDIRNKKELEKAREIARQVDEPTSPVNAIVSVLMLREGRDVQNVTVVVGLRPYTAKANILPEQTIGRGLRRMFRDLGGDTIERVDVIGNKAFMEFVEDLEKLEGMEFGAFEIGKDKLVIVNVLPDPEKRDKDIALPKLTPILARKKTLAEEIAALDIAAMSCPLLPRKPGDQTAQSFRYQGMDILTLEKLVEREYTIPEMQTAQEVISYYAKRIAQDVKLPSQFAALVPKVREFLETKPFGPNVDLDDPAMVKALGHNTVHYITVKAFVAALRALVIEEQTPRLEHAGRRLSETPGFPFSRPTFAADKTVFNLVATDNDFERRFARFLQDAPDVTAFAKLPSQFGFAIEYTDSAANLRYYEPDFVAVLADGTHCLIETKGREDVDVAHKDRAAALWCENATLLTGTVWRFLKVPQKEFELLQSGEYADLVALAPPSLF